MSTAATPVPEGLQKTPAERLAERIALEHAKDLLSRIRPQGKQPYLYLSGLHTCARNLYYQLEEGDKRPPVDPYVQGLFDSGQHQELWVKKKLLEFGLELQQAGKEVFVRYGGRLKAHHGEVIGKGKVDGIFHFVDDLTGPKGVKIPGEVKSMDGHMFKKLSTVDDLLDYAHTEKYLRQLLNYMLGESLENGVFVITDCRGHIKVIPVFLHNHLEVAELSLKKMEQAWEGKLAGEAPPRIAYHAKICGTCDFAPICLQDIVVGGSDRSDDPEEEALLARYLELEPASREAEVLWQEIKDRFQHRPLTNVAGRFEVSVKVIKKKRLNTKLLDQLEVEKASESKEERHVKVKDLLKKEAA
jgi:hypothetical protein